MHATSAGGPKDNEPHVEFSLLTQNITPGAAAMAHATDAWTKLAKRLGDHLRTSDMSVRGRYDGIDVELTTTWTDSGNVLRTTFTLRTPDMAAETRTFVWADGAFTSGEPSELPKKATTLLQDVFVDAQALTVDTDRIVLWDARVPMTEFAPLVKRLDQLAALAAALRLHGGPYR